MNRLHASAVLAALGLAALCALCPDALVPRARAQAEVLERVIAVVNEDAILLSEVRRRSIPFMEQAMGAPTEMERMTRMEQLYAQLMEHLIEERLFEDAARTMHVTVTTRDVERAIENVRRQGELNSADFWRAVRGQGFTESQYRSDVRRQLLRLKVLNNRARGRVNITETDVRARYDQRRRTVILESCFELSMILFRVDAGATATAVAEARQRAMTAKAELTPANFADSNAVDLGRICRGELNPALEEAMADMAVGEISDPVRGPNGFYLLHLRERAETASIPEYATARNDIYRQLLERAMAQQERILIRELRRAAVIERRL